MLTKRDRRLRASAHEEADLPAIRPTTIPTTCPPKEGVVDLNSVVPHQGIAKIYRAGEGIRTLDVHLGKRVGG
jgi:hypothetical protein